MNRPVETPFGPMSGCPDCGVIVLRGPHVCEHGVTNDPPVTISLEITEVSDDFYRWLTEADA